MGECNVPIKVSGRAVSYFGSQSISNDTSAVFELIKNSRDADSKLISITFEDLGGSDAKIVIEDDGTGMTQDDITGKWLVAGTDAKVKNPKSMGGKDVLGNKGIGRFACEKLAKRTTLESYPEAGDEEIWMSFDWTKYEKPDVTFDEVTHPMRTTAKKDDSRHGLKLTLEGLNSNWSHRDIRKVADELGTFILPKDLKKQDDMDIVINAVQYGVDNHHVNGTATKKAPIKMKARFEDGNLSVKISDVENNAKGWEDRSPEEQFGDMECGPFRFELYFYPRDTAKKKGGRYEQHYDDFDITEFLQKYSGIYLYKDGAWMKPLGGKNDWLRMEARRVQRRARIGLSQVYGVIQITQSENPGIKSTSHRETVQNNRAFSDLEHMILKSITQFEKYREEKKQMERERDQTSIPKAELAENNIDALIKDAVSLKGDVPEHKLNKILHDAKATKRYMQQNKLEKDDESGQAADLRHHEDTVAAIGLLTSYMASSITAPLNKNLGVMANMRKAMETTDFEKVIDKDIVHDGWRWITSLEDNTSKIVHFTSFVRELSRHIAASINTRDGYTQFKPVDAWKTVVSGFDDFVRELGIEVTDDVDEDMTVRFSRIDVETILTNLFLNSIDAIKKRGESGGKIHFKATHAKDLVLTFSDNGAGIKREDLDRIFDPFFTTAISDEGTAHGHGLGLAIVKKLASRKKGYARASSPSTEFSGGSTITVSFPGVSGVVRM